MTKPAADDADDDKRREITWRRQTRPVLTERNTSAAPRTKQALAVLSDFAGRGGNSAVRGQIFDDSPPHSGSMGQEAAEVWTAQLDAQAGRVKSGRLLGIKPHQAGETTAAPGIPAV